jgi:hypothetical protein
MEEFYDNVSDSYAQVPSVIVLSVKNALEFNKQEEDTVEEMEQLFLQK